MIVIYIPPEMTKAPKRSATRDRRARSSGIEGRIPVATAWMSTKGLPPDLQGAGPDPVVRVPGAGGDRDGARREVRPWRDDRRYDPSMSPMMRGDEAFAIIATVLGRRDTGWLTPEEVERLLDCYGLRTAPSERAATPEEAGEVAAGWVGSVALKAFGPDIVHKTEVGASRSDCPERERRPMRHARWPSGDDSRSLARGVPRPGDGGRGCRDARRRGPRPVVRARGGVGAGGTIVELLKDVAVRITPITDLDAREMVRSLGTFPFLDGFRGAPKADVAALEEVILRIGALAEQSSVGRRDGLQSRDGPAARRGDRRRAGPRAGGLTAASRSPPSRRPGSNSTPTAAPRPTTTAASTAHPAARTGPRAGLIPSRVTGPSVPRGYRRLAARRGRDGISPCVTNRKRPRTVGDAAIDTVRPRSGDAGGRCGCPGTRWIWNQGLP